MKDKIGDRMKGFYENRFRYNLPRRSYNIIRVDGKAFHTYTKGLDRPFDKGFIADMDATAIYLCKNIQGAKFAYVQSDEISVLVTDFDTLQTDAWFDNNVQKMTSVAASLATAEFNRLRITRAFGEYDAIPGKLESSDIKSLLDIKIATFDARVFQIPSYIEVANYFVWRQQDATRNSISSVAQSLCSHKELSGKNTDEQQELIFQRGGINWNDYVPREKRGGFIDKIVTLSKDGKTTKSDWKSIECPIFTQYTFFLGSRIPTHS